MMTLEVKNLSKSFDGIKAVNSACLSFKREMVTGLIGPNGAGKTTLFHLISGFLKPDSGEILYQGERIDGLRPWQVAKKGIGRLFQDVRVFSKMTVLDNVLSAFSQQTGENPLTLFKVKKIIKEEKERKKEALHWLEFVGLSGYENGFAENLSYGQQKLLAIARLLATGSEVLLLDEPTAGVNPKMVSSLLSLIRTLAEKEEKTVVVIEHNMAVIADVCDFVYFMADGRIMAGGDPSEVLRDKEVKRVYIGY